MVKRKRRMSLTPELVARCERPEPDSGPNPGFTPIEVEELDTLTTKLLEELAEEDLWLFAYGSLIWNPNFSFAEHRHGTIYGWHRAFCMEQKRWRGSPQQPGLMMALEKGGLVPASSSDCQAESSATTSVISSVGRSQCKRIWAWCVGSQFEPIVAQ